MKRQLALFMSRLLRSWTSAGKVFNADETGLFGGKKMPSRTYIAQEGKSMPGYKTAEDKFMLWLSKNAAGDLKLKPLIVYHSKIPRVFKRDFKAFLLVI